MSHSVAGLRLRPLLVVHALWALPMAAVAQRQATPADPLASQDSVVVVESVRVRTAPSPASLSIDEVPRGTALAIEAGTAINGPWIAVRFDERTAFVPREYVTVKLAPRAPVAATTSPAAPTQSPAPVPTRIVMAAVDAARPTAPVKEAPAPVRQPPPPVKETPAPVLQAGAPSHAEPRQASAEPPLSPTPAAPTPAATRETASGERGAPPPQPAQQGAPAPKSAAQDPSPMRRPALPGMVSVALLGSVTPYMVTTTGERVLHLSGHALVTLNVLGWGLYAAPEYGNGAGHRSTMLGGGVLRQILSVGPVHVTGLGGVTLYSEQPDGVYAASFVSRSIRAGSVGGLVSLPFVGPARIAYRGQYLRGLGADSDFHKIRHAVGLLF
ncbi:MAG: hypothetical protein M3Z10_06070 [Gemmatimonadota bacterium]|nr:hypothetical protein [Gemmatimonadota bacterium]